MENVNDVIIGLKVISQQSNGVSECALNCRFANE